MRNLTIIDSYDYVVDYIGNIVDIMNNSLSKFGKYSVNNGEVSNAIIEYICSEIQLEQTMPKKVKNISDHLLAPKKNNTETRKLAIEIDDKLIQLTNQTISIILQEGYKKIPSRTMFFRESLRVFYDIFIDKVGGEEIEVRRAMATLYNIYAQKLLGTDVHTWEENEKSWSGLGSDISIFISEAFLGPEFWQSILDNYEIINGIIKSGTMNLPDIKEITERFFKFIDKMIEVHESEPDILKFIEVNNDLPIVIHKNQLENLIEKIEPKYAKINNKMKLYFLFSYVEKEFRNIQIKIRFYFAPESQYIKKNAMEFTELYLIAQELTLADNGYLIQLPEQKKKIQKLLIDIANYNIAHTILIGSYFKAFTYGGYDHIASSPIILFLNNVLLAITSSEVEGIPDNIFEGFTIEKLGHEISKNLPQFRY